MKKTTFPLENTSRQPVFDAYFRAVLKPGKIWAYIVVAMCGKYEPLEQILKDTNGRLTFCLAPGDRVVKTIDGRKAFRAMTKKIRNQGHNISSIYVLSVEHPGTGWGDMNKTIDALIFKFDPELLVLEIFVARGQRNHRDSLFTKVIEGDLDEEMNQLRANAQSLLKEQEPPQAD